MTAGAARLDDQGRLEFWLGAECAGVGEIEVELTNDGHTLDTWRVRSEDPEGTDLERLVIGVAPEGFRESTALEHEWSQAELVRIAVHPAAADENPDDRRFYPSVPARAYIAVNSFMPDAEPGGDEWYLQDHGWYTAEEYHGLSDDGIYPYCAVEDS